MLRVLLLIVSLVIVFGCHTIRFDVAPAHGGDVVHERNSFYLFGLVPTRRIDVRQYCPNGVSAIREQTTFVDGLAEGFTLGIWSLRSHLVPLRALTARGPSMRRFVLSLALMLASLGCHRIHYANFSPQNPLQSSTPSEPVRVSSWQHFFVFGWVPDERRIDAAERCGRADNIESIRTQQTFVQFLIQLFATDAINIYSPYDGAIYCHQDPRTLP